MITLVAFHPRSVSFLFFFFYTMNFFMSLLANCISFTNCLSFADFLKRGFFLICKSSEQRESLYTNGFI